MKKLIWILLIALILAIIGFVIYRIFFAPEVIGSNVSIYFSNKLVPLN